MRSRTAVSRGSGSPRQLGAWSGRGFPSSARVRQLQVPKAKGDGVTADLRRATSAARTRRGQTAGTISRRLYGCDGLKARRRGQGREELVSVGREFGGNQLVEYGVTDSMRDAMPPSLPEHERPPRGLLGRGCLGDEICVGGSSISPRVERMTRAGWAVVSLEQGSEQA
eukprot:319992-Pyramimonas_sp.AAC.1